MDTPGITVRPLPEIVHPEHPDLNEVFFDDVVVPAANLVGEQNDGWAMANGSLAHERGMVWVGARDGPRGVARAGCSARRPALLDRLAADRAGAWPPTRSCESPSTPPAARCLGYRGFAKLVRGGTAPEQALMKLFTSEAASASPSSPPSCSATAPSTSASTTAPAIDEPQGPWLEQYFLSFGNTISAGSSEIQRNIIAERVLGLPR